MDTEKEFFSDGISRISVIGGVVRADLITLTPPDINPGGQPRPVLSGRLVMGIEAFMRSAEKMQEAAQAIRKAQQIGESAMRSQEQTPSCAPHASGRDLESVPPTDHTTRIAPDPNHPFP